MRSARANLTQKEIQRWSGSLQATSPTIASFALKYLLRSLPTLSNLHRWSKSPTDQCPNCREKETDRHVLNNCSQAVTEGRYTWRHNAVLALLISLIKPRVGDQVKLYVDLPGFYNPSELFVSDRPDIAFIVNGIVYVLN